MPGDAPTLVLLHYFGGSSAAWSSVIARLGATHRCIAPDLRGFGRAAALPDHWSVERAALDVDAGLAASGIGDHVLVGHSMGGKIALLLAAMRPERVRGLVLLAPSPPTAEPMDEAARRQALLSHGDRVAATERLRAVIARPLTPAVFARCVDNALASSAAAWSWWLESGSREDISASVGRLSVPACVIAGEADPVLPAAVLDRQVMPLLAEAQLSVIPGTGHLLPLEASDEAAALIVRFADAW